MHVVLTCTTLPHTPTHTHTYKCLLLTVCVREDVIGFHFCHRIEMAEAGHHSLKKHTRSGHHTTKRKAPLSAKTHLIHPPNVPTILQRDLKSVKRERKKEREKREWGRKKEREGERNASPSLLFSPSLLSVCIPQWNSSLLQEGKMPPCGQGVSSSFHPCLSVCQSVILSLSLGKGRSPQGFCFTPVVSICVSEPHPANTLHCWELSKHIVELLHKQQNPVMRWPALLLHLTDLSLIIIATNPLLDIGVI